MELKQYQKAVLEDLSSFLQYLEDCEGVRTAFNQYWEDRLGAYDPLNGKGMKPYQPTPQLPETPQVCIKVPTAGGKTFIACNALKPIFSHLKGLENKAVVWLVPSVSILEQTINALKDTSHPYRTRLDTNFNGNVVVYAKEDLITGASFNPTSVQNQLSVIVLSFDSLRTAKKDNRKLHEANGALMGFNGEQENSVVSVIAGLSPVIVVDESHNAQTDLSYDMLANLNPSFILDLTATPRKNSNIVSFVNALELKKENMVKLPVIVYNRNEHEEVIDSAIKLRKVLEAEAQREQKETGKYIRPIVLFQAQPRTGEENITFDKIKKALIASGIPDEEIKIKVSGNDELRDVKLNSPDCKVRYIITVNALKEGWDCPFAYILATLADKSSVVDVEQILGRVLRQPHVVKHKSYLLNSSYVITASRRFEETLDKIIDSLKVAGFSERDHRVALNEVEQTSQPIAPVAEVQELNFDVSKMDTASISNVTLVSESPDVAMEEDAPKINAPVAINTQEFIGSDETLTAIANKTKEAEQEMQLAMQERENLPAEILSPELQQMANYAHMVESFKEAALKIQIPKFFIDAPENEITGNEGLELLSRENLTAGFPIGGADSNIDFGSAVADIRRIDIQATTKDDYTPKAIKLSKTGVEGILKYLSSLPPESKTKQITGTIREALEDYNALGEDELNGFISSIVRRFKEEDIRHFYENQNLYIKRIKLKIDSLCSAYALTQMEELLKVNALKVLPHWSFPEKFPITQSISSIAKSLYNKEGLVKGFERTTLERIVSHENVLFWNRVIPRATFSYFLNGFINHYPDFIIVTQKGKVLLVETKGDDRDNSDSDKKIKLGAMWEKEAGERFKYFMIFETTKVDGAYTVDKFLELLNQL